VAQFHFWGLWSWDPCLIHFESMSCQVWVQPYCMNVRRFESGWRGTFSAEKSLFALWLH
jgi:hypothetical protein